MPPVVTIDIREGASITDRFGLYETTRIALVSGLLPPTGVSQLYVAINTPGVPGMFEVHPTITNIICLERTARAIDTGIIEVTCTYGIPDPQSGAAPPGDTISSPIQFQVGTSVQQVQTNKALDGAGNPTIIMKVGYTKDGELKEQGGLVEKLVPKTSYSAVRTEDISPLSKSRTYVGKLNLTPLFGDPVGSWMCTGINGVSSDGGNTYVVTYEFQYLGAEEAKANIFYIDPETGKPPKDATTGTEPGGLAVFDIYNKIDFTPLTFPP